MTTTITMAILAHPVHALLATTLLLHALRTAAAAVGRAIKVETEVANVRWAA